MNIQVSAVICTFNRANYLRKAIQSLIKQTLSKSLFEIIIVDNNSTDNTEELVKKEFNNVPNIHYFLEPIIGLSQARNTGFKNAKGAYIAYLDDDAIASPGWLETILKTFETVIPKPGCVGGKVEPIWEKPRPPWLSDKLLQPLSIVDWSEKPIVLKDNQYAVGANMAFPKEIIAQIGGFETRLGRKGKVMLSNEEIYVRDQLNCLGFAIYYHPQASVKHLVATSRLKKKWFINRAYWQGVSQALQLDLQEVLSRDMKKELAWSEFKTRISSPKFLLNLLIPPYNSKRLEMKCYSFMLLGYTLTLLKMLRQ